jgi:hypothetical protein
MRARAARGHAAAAPPNTAIKSRRFGEEASEIESKRIREAASVRAREILTAHKNSVEATARAIAARGSLVGEHLDLFKLAVGQPLRCLNARLHDQPPALVGAELEDLCGRSFGRVLVNRLHIAQDAPTAVYFSPSAPRLIWGLSCRTTFSKEL